MIIGLLPIDSRPCTCDFPVQLAHAAGAQVILPPAGNISKYRETPDISRNIRWLKDIAPKCDCLVVSAEQLIHGGLIQSRNASLTADEQRAVLIELEAIKKASPNTKIFLSTVLMRTSISTVNEMTRIWWEKVNEYSHLMYLALSGENKDIQAQYESLKREIPEEVLSAYHTARQVNHEINRACIELAAKKIVDILFICQEDCAPERIHWFEQRVLTEDIEKYGLRDRVFLFNGTDEAACELMQKAIHFKGTQAEVVWLSENTGFTANYEDRPFAENLKGHMRALNIREKKGAEKVICILPPKKKQGEACEIRTGSCVDYTPDELKAISEKIRNLTERGRRCYLLDLDFANGGNTRLLEILGGTMPILSLWGYAGWNTASNSLGTLLAQLLASDENSPLNQAFTSERILDDAVYQPVVRPEVTKRVRDSGEDIFNIKDIPKTETLLRESFQRHRPILERIFGGNVPEFEAKTRWNRLFEAEIFIKGNRPVEPKE